MTRVRRFEELIYRQKARVLVNTIHELTSRPDSSKDLRLREQVLDASGRFCLLLLKGATRELTLRSSVS